MEYMLIFSETTKEVARREDPKEAPAYWGAWNAYVQELQASGTVKSGNGLQAPHTATTLRMEGGKRHVQDGPHPDAKEHRAGTSSSTCRTSTSLCSGQQWLRV